MIICYISHQSDDKEDNGDNNDISDNQQDNNIKDDHYSPPSSSSSSSYSSSYSSSSSSSSGEEEYKGGMKKFNHKIKNNIKCIPTKCSKSKFLCRYERHRCYFKSRIQKLRSNFGIGLEFNPKIKLKYDEIPILNYGFVNSICGKIRLNFYIFHDLCDTLKLNYTIHNFYIDKLQIKNKNFLLTIIDESRKLEIYNAELTQSYDGYDLNIYDHDGTILKYSNNSLIIYWTICFKPLDIKHQDDSIITGTTDISDISNYSSSDFSSDDDDDIIIDHSDNCDIDFADDFNDPKLPCRN